MYPELFSVGHFSVATYGVVLALAVLAGGSLLARGFFEAGLPKDEAWSLVGYAVIGGLVGAKLYYVGLTGDVSALTSRGGLVWYGGLIGGAGAVAWAVRRKRLPLLSVADAVAPAAALGHGVGHIGCFFSGDSYGIPSQLPWAVAFPQGMPPSTAGNLRSVFGVDVPTSIPDSAVLAVHPTMLYSSATLLALAAFLWWYRRRNFAAGSVFGLYLVLAGVERFLVEFLRAKDDRFMGPLTTAQVVAVLVMTAGAALLWRLAGGYRTTSHAERRGKGPRRVPQIRRSGMHVRRPATAIQAGEPELR